MRDNVTVVMLVAACVVIPLLLVCWNSDGVLRRSPWPAVLAASWYGFGLARTAAANIRFPQEWDYGCFWLYGHLAAAHSNIYDPAAYSLATPFRFSGEFHQAVLSVGFPYPPPSIALFLPLGLIQSVPLGLTLWYVVQFTALAGAAWVLGRAFWPADEWRGPLLVLAIVLALPATALNVRNAQTNFVLLLLVALAFAARETPAGALWSALAIWVKPYAAALFVFDFARRSGRRIGVAAVTVALSLAVSIVLVGPAAFATYLRSNPAGREPSFAFVESVNQSLLAVVLRLQTTLPEHVSALHQPLYLIGAFLLAAATFTLCVRRNVPTDAAFCASLLLGLLIYPGALSSYGVALIVPILVLWRHRNAFPGGTAAVAGLTSAAVILQSAALQHGFIANLLVWCACSYLLLGRGESEEREERGKREEWTERNELPLRTGPLPAGAVR